MTSESFESERLLHHVNKPRVYQLCVQEHTGDITTEETSTDYLSVVWPSLDLFTSLHCQV